jgi:hypothetical protein
MLVVVGSCTVLNVTLWLVIQAKKNFVLECTVVIRGLVNL